MILKAMPPSFHPIMSIGGVTVEMSSPVVHYVSGCAIDADGAPRCYHPGDWGTPALWVPAGRSAYGLDAPENGGKAERNADGSFAVVDSWGWATDDGTRSGRPVIQGARDPAPGYYVSKTSLKDPNFSATDPRAYVWADVVPYLAIPRKLAAEPFNIRMGDVAMVQYKNRTVFAIVADIGNDTHIGEGSLALVEKLGASGTPRKGGISGGVSFHVFCGTSRMFRFAPYYRHEVGEEIENVGQATAKQFGVVK